jgi:hypothetical protein
MPTEKSLEQALAEKQAVVDAIEKTESILVDISELPDDVRILVVPALVKRWRELKRAL